MRFESVYLRQNLRLFLFAALLVLMVVGVFFLLETESLDLTTRLLMAPQSSAAIFTLVFVGLTLDIFLPVPSTLLAAAAAAILGDTVGFLAVWLGLNAGCLLGYEFGATAGHATLSRMIEDSHKRRFDWLESRFGLGALVICRPVPVLAEVSILIAGSARLSRRILYPLCLIANAIVAALYVWAIPTVAN